ncbi:uncharacterized protein [Asterias amurensis]|uniref:uncharacterized protein n=1 Tax=Asterias amurensis TaxID=7602 RepID=UPI003AB5FFFA
MLSGLHGGVTYNMCGHYQSNSCGCVNLESCVKHRVSPRATPRLFKMSELLTAVKKGEHKYVRKVFSTLPDDEVAQLLAYRAPQTKETLLFCACVTGNYEMVRLLLWKGRGVCGLYTAWGAGPLHAASERGHELVVRLLLKHGAEINVQTSYGDTPLHLAAHRGHYGAVRCLVEGGCKLDIKNSKRKTALDDAESARHHRIVQYLQNVMRLDVERAKDSGQTYTQNKMADAIEDDLMKTQPMANFPSQQRLDRSISWDCTSNSSANSSWNVEDDKYSSYDSTDSEWTTNDLSTGSIESLSRCAMSQGLDQIPESRDFEIHRQGGAFPRATSPVVEHRTRGRSSSDTTDSRVKYLESLVKGLQRGLIETQDELKKTKNELQHTKTTQWSPGQLTVDQPSDDTATLLLKLRKRLPSQPN